RLETVADLDADLPLLRKDEEDQAVVVLLVANFPSLRAVDREIFERFILERGEDVDDELRAARLLEGLQLRVERFGRRSIHEAGLVGEPLRRRRWDVECEGGARGEEAANGEQDRRARE